MDYEMEELVPIVGKLAEKYTSHESTSITYEKAEQLKQNSLWGLSYIVFTNYGKAVEMRRH